MENFWIKLYKFFVFLFCRKIGQNKSKKIYNNCTFQNNCNISSGRE